MTTYRRKPLLVDAMQLPTKERHMTSAESEAALAFIDAHEDAFKGFRIDNDGWSVVTIDGNRVTVPWGAYVVIDNKGFAYPCDAGVFVSSHDSVGGSEAPSGLNVSTHKADPTVMFKAKRCDVEDRHSGHLHGVDDELYCDGFGKR